MGRLGLDYLIAPHSYERRRNEPERYRGWSDQRGEMSIQPPHQAQMMRAPQAQMLQGGYLHVETNEIRI
jgi:hypothetical protein